MRLAEWVREALLSAPMASGPDSGEATRSRRCCRRMRQTRVAKRLGVIASFRCVSQTRTSSSKSRVIRFSVRERG